MSCYCCTKTVGNISIHIIKINNSVGRGLGTPPTLTLIGAPAMIFIDNKFHRWYFAIIENAKRRISTTDVYSERHHIIPKCMGGDNTKSNLVSLTAREHFVCHRLLPKMVKDIDIKNKLIFAAWAMSTAKPKSKLGSRNIHITSKYYETLRGIVAKENRIRQIGKSPGNKGVPQSEERIQKTRDVPNITCPHCYMQMKPWVYARFHGDKCRRPTDFVGPLPKLPRSARNVKKFEATSPSGVKSVSSNLKQFCKDNNLSFAQCRRTAVGKYESYKGWKFSYIIQFGNTPC